MSLKEINERVEKKLSTISFRKTVITFLTIFLIGTVLLTFADIFTKFRFIQTHESTQGKVLKSITDGFECLNVEWPVRSRNGDMFIRTAKIKRASFYKYCAVVSYNINGETYETELKGGSLFQFNEGDELTVYYDQNNPIAKEILVSRWDLYYSEAFVNIFITALILFIVKNINLNEYK